MHLGQARGLVIGLVQPGVAQEDDDDDTVAMVNVNVDGVGLWLFGFGGRRLCGGLSLSTLTKELV